MHAIELSSFPRYELFPAILNNSLLASMARACLYFDGRIQVHHMKLVNVMCQ